MAAKLLLLNGRAFGAGASLPGFAGPPEAFGFPRRRRVPLAFGERALKRGSFAPRPAAGPPVRLRRTPAVGGSPLAFGERCAERRNAAFGVGKPSASPASRVPLCAFGAGLEKDLFRRRRGRRPCAGPLRGRINARPSAGCIIQKRPQQRRMEEESRTACGRLVRPGNGPTPQSPRL